MMFGFLCPSKDGTKETRSGQTNLGAEVTQTNNDNDDNDDNVGQEGT